MRLIDADELRKDVLDMPNCYNGFSDTYDKAMILDIVDEQPTVDVESLYTKHEDIGYEKGYRDGYAEALEVTDNTEPVRHGRWLDVLVADDDEGETDGVECSECGYTDINVYWAKTYHRFCPNCGAKMDEVKDG